MGQRDDYRIGEADQRLGEEDSFAKGTVALEDLVCWRLHEWRQHLGPAKVVKEFIQLPAREFNGSLQNSMEKSEVLTGLHG